jgi:hypothetical protein
MVGLCTFTSSLPPTRTPLTRGELRTGWVKAWKKMYSYPSIMKRYDFGLDHSKIGKGDRTFRKHRAIEIPFGL